jgi:hypothetical protein
MDQILSQQQLILQQNQQILKLLQASNIQKQYDHQHHDYSDDGGGCLSNPSLSTSHEKELTLCPM